MAARFVVEMEGAGWGNHAVYYLVQREEGGNDIKRNMVQDCVQKKTPVNDVSNKQIIRTITITT
jgi:hypothetical protein